VAGNSAPAAHQSQPSEIALEIGRLAARVALPDSHALIYADDRDAEET
jgi:hypothetical protein